MLMLPYTGAGCTKHSECSGSTPDTPYWALASYCPSKQVQAVLDFLNSTDVRTWFGNKGNAESIVYYTPRHWQKVVAASAHATFDPDGIGNVSLSYNDLHCNSCHKYVSKELDFEHWDSLCSNCYHHADECACCETCNCSECQCCGTCGKAPGWCDCCEHCGYDICECSECEDCGNLEYACSCNSNSGRSYFGSTKVAPWTEREPAPMVRTLPTIAECQNSNIDPVQAAANYYLLDAIRSGARMAQVTGASDGWLTAAPNLRVTDSMLSALTISAGRSFSALVDYLAPSFLAYAVAAVGGELRYHKACSGKVLPSTRSNAWNAFTTLVQDNGADVLFDANVLFLEFGDGAYGGKKWGDAAKIIGMYLNDKMPDSVFCDRVFALQHNGGCFLNKVNWARRNAREWNLDSILYVLNAHAGKDKRGNDLPNGETDWATLLSCATPDVRQMWEMSERAIRRLAKRFGGDLPRQARKARTPAPSAW